MKDALEVANETILYLGAKLKHCFDTMPLDRALEATRVLRDELSTAERAKINMLVRRKMTEPIRLIGTTTGRFSSARPNLASVPRPDPKEEMTEARQENNGDVTVEVTFKKWEYDRVKRLAERRNQTVQDCLRGFAQVCQPEAGDHWSAYRGPTFGPGDKKDK